jgi:hypothetical protein
MLVLLEDLHLENEAAQVYFSILSGPIGPASVKDREQEPAYFPE